MLPSGDEPEATTAQLTAALAMVEERLALLESGQAPDGLVKRSASRRATGDGTAVAVFADDDVDADVDVDAVAAPPAEEKRKWSECLSPDDAREAQPHAVLGHVLAIYDDDDMVYDDDIFKPGDDDTPDFEGFFEKLHA
ncbi:snoRNA binding protein [Aureococcus anophagefferens]|nr:snoRNA binding protein [Aureococcus anophagefferens]